MANNNLHIGLVGEALAQYKIMKMGYSCTSVNLEKTDLIILAYGQSFRCQVKSSSIRTRVRKDRRNDKKLRPSYTTDYHYRFAVSSGSKSKKPLTAFDTDIIALVGLDHEQIIFVTADQLTGSANKQISPRRFNNQTTEDSLRHSLRKLACKKDPTAYRVARFGS